MQWCVVCLMFDVSLTTSKPWVGHRRSTMVCCIHVINLDQYVMSISSVKWLALDTHTHVQPLITVNRKTLILPKKFDMQLLSFFCVASRASIWCAAWMFFTPPAPPPDRISIFFALPPFRWMSIYFIPPSHKLLINIRADPPAYLLME